MVKRYGLYTGEMHDEEGNVYNDGSLDIVFPFVLASDYDALAAELAATQELHKGASDREFAALARVAYLKGVLRMIADACAEEASQADGGSDAST